VRRRCGLSVKLLWPLVIVNSIGLLAWRRDGRRPFCCGVRHWANTIITVPWFRRVKKDFILPAMVGLLFLFAEKWGGPAQWDRVIKLAPMRQTSTRDALIDNHWWVSERRVLKVNKENTSVKHWPPLLYRRTSDPVITRSGPLNIFRVRRSRGEMYMGHGCLCVCVSLCLSLAAFPRYCTDLGVTWGNGKGCP